MQTGIINLLGVVVGAIIGGSVSFAVAWLDRLKERERAASERAVKMIELRHEQVQRDRDSLRKASSSFLRACFVFQDHLLTVNLALRQQEGGQVPQEMHDAYAEAWRNLRAAFAALLVLAPKSLADACIAYQEAMANMSDAVDSAYSANRPTRGMEKLRGDVEETLVRLLDEMQLMFPVRGEIAMGATISNSVQL